MAIHGAIGEFAGVVERKTRAVGIFVGVEKDVCAIIFVVAVSVSHSSTLDLVLCAV